MSRTQKNAPSWYRELEQPPFDAPQWTAQQQRELRERLRGGSRCRMGWNSRMWGYTAGATLMIVMLIGILWLAAAQHPFGGAVQQPGLAGTPVIDWEVVPGGDAEVGTRGARWLLSGPLEELHGRQVEIIATHVQSGYSFEELPATTIDETTAMEYEANRFFPRARPKTGLVSELNMPLPGTWRYDLYLDGAVQGSRELRVSGPDWSASPTFRSGSYTLHGIESKLGLLNGKFEAGQVNKHMWHFWGTDEQVTGSIDVYAVQAGTSRLEAVLIDNPVSPSPLNGADAAFPCHMTLPEPGQWMLLVTLDDRFLGAVAVEVLPAADQDG